MAEYYTKAQMDVIAAQIGERIKAAQPFLPMPERVDDTSDGNRFYFGWQSINGGWLIQRQMRAGAEKHSVTTGYADLASAWPHRATLTYS